MSLLSSIIKAASSSTKDINKSPKKSTEDLLWQLHELTVHDAGDADKLPIPFRQIVTSPDHDPNKIVIVSFLRRFGCPVCRAVATGLSYLKEQIMDPMGIELIAVAIEDVGYKEFSRKQYFTGHVYVDNNGSLFQALRLKRLGVHNMFGIKDMSRMKAAVALSSNQYFNDTRNFQGDYAQLGGLYIFKDNGEKILLEFKEEYAGDTPFIGDILDAVDAPAHIRAMYPNGKVKVLNIAQEAIRQQKRFRVLKDKDSVSDISQKLSKSPSYGDVTSPIQRPRDFRSNSILSVSNSLSRPSHIHLPPQGFPSVQLNLTNAYGVTTSPGHSPLSLTSTESTANTTSTKLYENGSHPTSETVPDTNEYFDSIFTKLAIAVNQDHDGIAVEDER